ncbi:MAG: CAP domain-containing protein, partial [Acidimicrobiia bacterium]
MRRFLATTIAALCLVAAAPRPAGAAGAEEVAGVVASVNAIRSGRNLPPLEVHPELVAKAQAWAAHMAATGTLAHSGLTDGITANWLTLG